jgi:hypothetical protein
VTETSAGTVTYSITCAGAPPAARASTSVAFVTAAAPPPAASSSGGGGSLDPLLLLLLSLPVGISLMRRTATDGVQVRPGKSSAALERRVC